MIIPLWQLTKKSRHRLATKRIELETKSFQVGTHRFVYEANDMRLFLADEAGRVELSAGAEAFTTRAPEFPLRSGGCGMVTLVMTKACMLKCHYCFADPLHKANPLTLATAQKTIALIPPERPLNIAFFGGEPLIAWERIREIVAYAENLAQARKVAVKFSITTNATILNADKARYMDAHGFSVIVSLDGTEKLHNANRPLRNGKGSYQLTRRGITALAKSPDLAARTTLRGTFDGKARRAHLLERVKHLNSVARENGFRNVSVEPADISESCFRGAAPVHPDGDLFGEYQETAAWYAAELAAGRTPLFHHLSVRIRRLQLRSPAPSECGAGTGYISADPQGNLYACHRLAVSKIGDLENGIDPAQQSRWRDNRYTARKNCPSCWLRNACGGGCRQNSLEKSGDITHPELLGCWVAETCIKLAAWVLAETRPAATDALPKDVARRIEQRQVTELA